MDLRAGIEGGRKSRPHWNSIPGPSSPHQVAILIKLFRPTVTIFFLIKGLSRGGILGDGLLLHVSLRRIN
jgi:hypothetical protein